MNKKDLLVDVELAVIACQVSDSMPNLGRKFIFLLRSFRTEVFRALSYAEAMPYYCLRAKVLLYALIKQLDLRFALSLDLSTFPRISKNHL